MENFQVGAGLDFRLSSLKEPADEIEDGEKATYDYDNLISIPLYVTSRYNFKNSTEITPSIKLNLEYVINIIEIK